MILVTGSTALRAYGLEIKRPVLDVDIICARDYVLWAATAFHRNHDSEVNWDKAEDSYVSVHPSKESGLPIIDIELDTAKAGAELIEILSKPENAKYIQRSHLSFDGVEIFYVHPSVVLAMKLSHKYKKDSPHFMKTMKDIMQLKAAGYKVPKCLSDWLKERKRLTYNYKHPKLMNNDKEGFFTGDGVNYVFDHDAIHEAVKLLEQPAYRYFQPDGEEVHVDKEEFFKLPKSVQLLAVLEESYVLSLERAIIPFNLYDDPAKCRKAFATALMKVCTSITSGWFRKFAYDNFFKVWAIYNDLGTDYVTKFKALADAGKVAPYTGKAYG